MNIENINKMSDDIFIDYFKNIFEKTPLLAKVTFSHKPFKDKAHLIETFINQFENLDPISKKPSCEDKTQWLNIGNARKRRAGKY